MNNEMGPLRVGKSTFRWMAFSVAAMAALAFVALGVQLGSGILGLGGERSPARSAQAAAAVLDVMAPVGQPSGPEAETAAAVPDALPGAAAVLGPDGPGAAGADGAPSGPSDGSGGSGGGNASPAPPSPAPGPVTPPPTSPTLDPVLEPLAPVLKPLPLADDAPAAPAAPEEPGLLEQLTDLVGL